MYKFRNHLLAAIGGLALIGLAALALPRASRAGGGPVPVSVSGVTATADVDNPEKHPFQIVLVPSSNSSNTATATYTVPVDKEAVIEFYFARQNDTFVSIPGHSSSDQETGFLDTKVGATTASYTIIPLEPRQSETVWSSPVRIYADPGTTIKATFDTTGSDASAKAYVILSGHFVNVP